MPRVKTPNQGAGDTRRQITLMIRTMLQEGGTRPFINGENLIKRIGRMPLLALRRPGGLGPK